MLHLIRPPYAVESLYPPLNLLLLAGCVEQSYPVAVTDLVPDHLKRKPSLSSQVQRILDNPARILGFTSMSSSYPTTLKLAQMCKQEDPNRFVILGGPHAGFVAEETLTAFSFIDAVVIGEGERTLAELLDALKTGTDMSGIQGLAFRDGKRIIRTNSRPPEQCLESLPFPAYHLIHNVDDYYEGEAKRHTEIEAGRGCPFNCNYCSTSVFFGRRYRMKSPKRIVDEMRWLRDHWQIDTFGLIHDNLTVNRRHVKELCDYLNETGDKFEWFSASRTDSMDRETARMMANAGCKGIFFGVESGSPTIQNWIGKRLNLADAERTLRAVSEEGHALTASFIVGFPGETTRDLEDTLDVGVRMRVIGRGVGVQFHPLSPQAGTRLLAEYRDQLRFDLTSMAYNDFIAELDAGDEQQEWVRTYPDIFSSYYVVPPEHYPLETLWKVRGCYFHLVNAYPYTLYAMKVMGGVQHLEIVDRLVKKLPIIQGVWALDELNAALEALVSEWPGEIGKCLLEIHRYEAAWSQNPKPELQEWRSKVVGSAVAIKPIRLLEHQYDIPAIFDQLDKGDVPSLAQRHLHIALVMEPEGEFVRTIEISPLVAYVIGCVQEGQALTQVLEVLSQSNPLLHSEPEREQWREQIVSVLREGQLISEPLLCTGS